MQFVISCISKLKVEVCNKCKMATILIDLPFIYPTVHFSKL